MSKRYYWCSREFEPDYLECAKCPFSQSPETCSCKHEFHPDAIRACDMKRVACGLPLISDDFDLMKENFMRKEVVDAQEAQKPHIRLSEQMKLDAMKRPKPKEKMTILIAAAGIAGCAALGFPAAYVFQFFQIFAMFVFDTLELFLVSGPHPEAWSDSFNDSFFYASYQSRYLFWTSFMVMFFGWAFYDEDNESDLVGLVVRIIGTASFVIIALVNVQLLISALIGPMFIFFGLLLTAKR